MQVQHVPEYSEMLVVGAQWVSSFRIAADNLAEIWLVTFVTKE